MRVGNIYGFAALVKKRDPHHTMTHCFLCWHILAKKKKKKIASKPERIFVYCPKSFQLYQSKGLESLPFKEICQKDEERIQSSSHHTGVCQLSRARVPKPLIEL